MASPAALPPLGLAATPHKISAVLLSNQAAGGVALHFRSGLKLDALQGCQGSIAMPCHAQASLQHSDCAEESAALNGGNCQPGRCLF